MKKEAMISWLNGKENELRELAKKIWEHPELALEEIYAAELQISYLKENGFTISTVEGLPTAFIAEYGDGLPVIGILGEYDALPGLSQKAVPYREANLQGGNGHGCGHNLIGTGGIGAAASIKECISKGGLKGRIRYFGCPAEEKYCGKELMLRAGAFEGTDCCLSWHPEGVNKITKDAFRAVYDVNYRFKGTTSHYVADRELGGSAVSGVELLNIGVQFIRAHLNDSFIIESCIVKGAEASNVLPEVTEVSYGLRADTTEDCRRLMKRIDMIAEGAALMSGTAVEWEDKGTYYNNIYNEVLGDVIFENMKNVEKQKYSELDFEFLGKIAETVEEKNRRRIIDYYNIPEEDCMSYIHTGAVKSDRSSYKPSSDVGNVSWHMPVGMFYAATGPIGVPMHTWQATALCGSGTGIAGMMYAARVMAATAFDLMNDPELVKRAWLEFKEAVPAEQ